MIVLSRRPAASARCVPARRERLQTLPLLAGGLKVLAVVLRWGRRCRGDRPRPADGAAEEVAGMEGAMASFFSRGYTVRSSRTVSGSGRLDALASACRSDSSKGCSAWRARS